MPTPPIKAAAAAAGAASAEPSNVALPALAASSIRVGLRSQQLRHHSHIQPRTVTGRFCYLSDPRLHGRFWLLAITLGIAHPLVVRAAAGYRIESLPSAEGVLADAATYLGARAARCRARGQRPRDVALFQVSFPGLRDRPATWPAAATRPKSAADRTSAAPTTSTTISTPANNDSLPLRSQNGTRSSSDTPPDRSTS